MMIQSAEDATDEVKPEEIAEALGHMCAWAKRQQHIVAQFADDEPTAWDKAHRRMDVALDDYLEATSAAS